MASPDRSLNPCSLTYSVWFGNIRKLCSFGSSERVPWKLLTFRCSQNLFENMTVNAHFRNMHAPPPPKYCIQSQGLYRPPIIHPRTFKGPWEACLGGISQLVRILPVLPSPPVWVNRVLGSHSGLPLVVPPRVPEASKQAGESS